MIDVQHITDENLMNPETILYEKGLRLYGEDKIRRQSLIERYIRGLVPEGRGKLEPAQANEVYEKAARKFGLTRWGIIAVVPSELKPTNVETLAYARSKKTEKRQEQEVVEAPTEPKRRDSNLKDAVRAAAQEFVNPETGRIPAERVTKVYEELAERFQRTRGTISNYLQGLGPTAKECAALRWEIHKDKRKPQPGANGGTRPQAALTGATAPATHVSEPEPEIDFTNHPAALFPGGQPPETKRQRQVRRRTPTTARDLVDRDGRLTDYDEKPAEVLDRKLDSVTEEFLQTFKVGQVGDLIDALNRTDRSMKGWAAMARQELGDLVGELRASRTDMKTWLDANGLATRAEVDELKSYVAELEKENQRLTERWRAFRSLLQDEDA